MLFSAMRQSGGFTQAHVIDTRELEERRSEDPECVHEYDEFSQVMEECGEGCKEWREVVLHSGICVELDSVLPVTGRPRCAKPELSTIHPKDNIPNTV